MENQPAYFVRRLQKMVFQSLHSQLRHSIRIKSFLYRLVYFLPEKWRMPDEVRKALKEIADSQEAIFFVNIGCNDGLAGNPLREFIVTYKWKGIMVEPVSYVFDRLVKVYKAFPEIRCENAAISERDSSQQFYYLRKNNVLPPGYDQVGSFNKQKILGENHLFPGLVDYIESREVPCLTLQQLLSKNKVDRVDVFVIDAEGFDFEIIKQIDLKKNRPTIIIFEVIHLSPADKASGCRLLENAGYQLNQISGDIVAKLINLSK